MIITIPFFVSLAPDLFALRLKHLRIDKKIDLPLFKKAHKRFELVYFGYSGCADVCTPILEQIAGWYKQSALKNRVQVTFFDISQPLDPQAPQKFAALFDPRFKGYRLNQQQIQPYTRSFSVYFAPSLFNNGSFDHSSNLYLVEHLKSSVILRYIYILSDFEQIENDIKALQNE